MLIILISLFSNLIKVIIAPRYDLNLPSLGEKKEYSEMYFYAVPGTKEDVHDSYVGTHLVLIKVSKHAMSRRLALCQSGTTERVNRV